MSKKGKKSKQQQAKTSTAQTVADFDDMLADLRAADLTTPANNGTTGQASLTYASSSSSNSSRRRFSRPTLGTTGKKVPEDSIIQCCRRGDIAQA
jgi:hypothetical protein